MASNHDQSESEEGCIGYIKHRRFAKITEWILWLISNKSIQFEDLVGDEFLEALWFVLHQQYHDQVPADAVKLNRRWGIHLAHVVDISQEQFDKALNAQPIKPKTKIMAKTTKGPRPSDDRIKETFERAKEIFNEEGTTTNHMLAGTVKVTQTRRSVHSLTSDRPLATLASDSSSSSAHSSTSELALTSDTSSTSARASTSFSKKRPFTSELLAPSKRIKGEQESEPDWHTNVLQMTLKDFKDIKVIGSSKEVIEEYGKYNVSEFLNLPVFAQAKAVASPAEALETLRAANHKKKEDDWFQKLQRLYQKAQRNGKRYIDVALPDVSDDEDDSGEMESNRKDSGESIGGFEEGSKADELCDQLHRVQSPELIPTITVQSTTAVGNPIANASPMNVVITESSPLPNQDLSVSNPASSANVQSQPIEPTPQPLNTENEHTKPKPDASTFESPKAPVLSLSTASTTVSICAGNNVSSSPNDTNSTPTDNIVTQTEPTSSDIALNGQFTQNQSFLGQSEDHSRNESADFNMNVTKTTNVDENELTPKMDQPLENLNTKSSSADPPTTILTSTSGVEPNSLLPEPTKSDTGKNNEKLNSYPTEAIVVNGENSNQVEREGKKL